MAGVVGSWHETPPDPLLDSRRKWWQQYYDQIREGGKLLLPMVKLFFLAPPEE